MRVVKKKVQSGQKDREERERSSEREGADDEDGECFLPASNWVNVAEMIRNVDEIPPLPVRPLPKSLKKKRLLRAQEPEEAAQPQAPVEQPSKEAVGAFHFPVNTLDCILKRVFKMTLSLCLPRQTQCLRHQHP